MAVLMFGIKRTEVDYDSYLMCEENRRLFNVYFTDETDQLIGGIDTAKVYGSYPSVLKALQTIKYMGRKISEYCKVCEIVVDHKEYIPKN